MATYLERYRMRNSVELRQRLTVAVWVKAASVIADGGATSQQKQDARSRIKRELTDQEHFILTQFFSVFPGAEEGERASDVVLQSAVDAAYAQLPGP